MSLKIEVQLARIEDKIDALCDALLEQRGLNQETTRDVNSECTCGRNLSFDEADHSASCGWLSGSTP